MNRVNFAALGGIAALTCMYVQAVGRDTADAPVLVAEGMMSGLTFSPDNRTVYFGRLDSTRKRWAIFQAQVGNWAAATRVEFSSEHHDAGPAISPDGKRLFFWSLRPTADVVSKESRLWVAARSGSGWGNPSDVGTPVNRPGYPSANLSVSASGMLYFVTKAEGALGWDDVHRAVPDSAGGYARIENLGPSVNSTEHEFDVHVAPDETYVLFSSNRPGGHGKADIYISTRAKDGWTPARNLGAVVNSVETELSPSVSPDGRYLYFSRISGEKAGVYRVPAEAVAIPPGKRPPA